MQRFGLFTGDSRHFMIDAVACFTIAIGSSFTFIWAGAEITKHFNIQECVNKGQPVEYCRDLWNS